MLYSERGYARSKRLEFKNPARVKKVRKSMARLKFVWDERLKVRACVCACVCVRTESIANACKAPMDKLRVIAPRSKVRQSLSRVHCRSFMNAEWTCAGTHTYKHTCIHTLVEFTRRRCRRRRRCVCVDSFACWSVMTSSTNQPTNHALDHGPHPPSLWIARSLARSWSCMHACMHA